MRRSLAATLLACALHAQDAAPPSFGPGVYVGYQGWFYADGDGCGVGFRHYGRGGRFEPGACSVDFWPDMSECSDDERYATPFRHADGRVAHVYSAGNAATVRRHFAWMAEHGIDGAFAQRFGASLRSPRLRAARDRVLANVRAGANAHGRAWALMYDLSGLRSGEVDSVVAADFRRLHQGGLFEDPRYLRYDGKPLVAVWGVGFADGRDYTLAECAALVDLIQQDPEVGGNAVMLGLPHGFRRGRRDAVADPALQTLAAKVEVVSPWAVGRYADLEQVRRNQRRTLEPDLRWCRARDVSYLPVVFPGFSWHNMKRGGDRSAPLDQIPRRGGAFLWQQALAARRAGATTVYVAMFDELDEGTAIFKVDPAPPVGASPFLTYGDRPSDHYLWLTGAIGSMLRGAAPADDALPVRSRR